MTFPQIVNSGSNNSNANISSGTAWTFSYGFTATEGNLLLLAIGADGSPGVTVPSNFSQVYGNGSANALYVYKGLAGASESSANITPGATESLAAAMWEISGFESLGNVENSPVNPSSVTANPDPSSLNPRGWEAEDTLWFAIYSWDGNVSHSSYPTNYTLGQQTSRYANSQGCGIAGAARELNAVSEDPGAATLSGSEDWRSTTIAIRPTLVMANAYFNVARRGFSMIVP